MSLPGGLFCIIYVWLRVNEIHVYLEKKARWKEVQEAIKKRAKEQRRKNEEFIKKQKAWQQKQMKKQKEWHKKQKKKNREYIAQAKKQQKEFVKKQQQLVRQTTERWERSRQEAREERVRRQSMSREGSRSLIPLQPIHHIGRPVTRQRSQSQPQNHSGLPRAAKGAGERRNSMSQIQGPFGFRVPPQIQDLLRPRPNG